MSADNIFPPWIEKQDGSPDFQLMSELAKHQPVPQPQTGFLMGFLLGLFK
jgi:hypothetical protein